MRKRYIIEFANGDKWYFYNLYDVVDQCFKPQLKKRKAKLVIEKID